MERHQWVFNYIFILVKDLFKKSYTRLLLIPFLTSPYVSRPGVYPFNSRKFTHPLLFKMKE